MSKLEDKMDLEYIKLLMLYSDQQYPFKMAKADPGMSESVKGINRYMNKHGQSRKLENGEANRILLSERTASKMVRDIDDDYTPKAEQTLGKIEESFKGNVEPRYTPPPNNDLEKEIARLKQMVQDKEAELQRARAGNITQPPLPLKGAVPPTDGGIVERKLEDTGYTDKINPTE
jgi:hypothetical protein